MEAQSNMLAPNKFNSQISLFSFMMDAVDPCEGCQRNSLSVLRSGIY